MSTANQEVAKRWFEEVWNKKRREAIEEMMQPDAVLHERGEDKRGYEFCYALFEMMHSNFSGIHITIDDAIGDGDMVWLRWTCRMQHTGTGMGVPATGKAIETTGMTALRIADGKLAEGWQNWDMLTVLEAIGVRDKSSNVLAVSA